MPGRERVLLIHMFSPPQIAFLNPKLVWCTLPNSKIAQTIRCKGNVHRASNLLMTIDSTRSACPGIDPLMAQLISNRVKKAVGETQQNAAAASAP